MLPTAVVSEAVVPFLAVARLYINQVKIVESEVREVLADMNPLPNIKSPAMVIPSTLSDG